MSEDSKPHSIRPDRLREMAQHIEPDYPASAEDLLFLADSLGGLYEQLEAAEERAEMAPDPYDVRKLERENEGLKEQLETLEGAARRVLERMNPRVPWPQEYLDLLDAVGSASYKSLS